MTSSPNIFRGPEYKSKTLETSFNDLGRQRKLLCKKILLLSVTGTLHGVAGLSRTHILLEGGGEFS